MMRIEVEEEREERDEDDDEVKKRMATISYASIHADVERVAGVAFLAMLLLMKYLPYYFPVVEQGDAMFGMRRSWMSNKNIRIVSNCLGKIKFLFFFSLLHFLLNKKFKLN